MLRQLRSSLFKGPNNHNAEQQQYAPEQSEYETYNSRHGVKQAPQRHQTISIRPSATLQQFTADAPRCHR